MKKLEGKKKVIVIGVIAVLVIGAIVLAVNMGGSNDNPAGNTGNGGNAGNNGNNQNIENTVNNQYVNIEGTKTVGNIEFSNIRINLVEENKCEFLADVKNTTQDFLNSTNIRIKVIDASGQVDEIFGGIVTELAGLEPNTFKTMVLADITDAVDVELEVIN